MRKWWFLLMAALMLTGCSGPVDYETVSDELITGSIREASQITVVLPMGEDAVTVDSEGGTLWLCGDYTVCTQTLAGGDLERTLQTVTGRDMDSLTLVKLEQGEDTRYECVWVCAGENGEQMNRAVILDDGAYHYVLSLQGAAEQSGELAPVWKQITEQFGLHTVP